MPSEIPYLPSAGNVPLIFEKIRSAGTPPKFTLEFLSKNLGFASSQDRGMPKLLKQLGFLSPDGVPTSRYNEYKANSTGGRALARGLREGWAPLFLADERIYEKTAGDVKDVCKSVTGQGDSAAQKMASTFLAIAKLADWSSEPADEEVSSELVASLSNGNGQAATAAATAGGSLALHQDIHVHLPSTTDVSVYRAVFQALREELM